MNMLDLAAVLWAFVFGLVLGFWAAIWYSLKILKGTIAAVMEGEIKNEDSQTE